MKAYELIENRKIADLNSDAKILRHKKTGARIAILQNEDENKVFYIGFRTPPKESTGVMHILEHSVLCGSKSFPVKDPFIELAKGSLNTFLNAMTYPDKTVYPVASCNDKDFQNLMHVYLDAVFYPNIYDKDLTFKQEGWHYEMESEDSDLTINGVVYNEMKGAFSSPDDVLERQIFNSLFPDTTYSEESGGDPKVIPELTYDHYLDIHRQYYHPSNCYIYLYGNMNVEEKLAFIDENYLSKFDAIEIDSTIETQKGFEKPIEIYDYFSVTDSEPMEDNSYLSYNCVTGTSLNEVEYIAYQILDYALCSAPGAVLKQAMLEAGIGKDIYSFYDNGVKQPYFSIVAKNANRVQKESFVNLIEDTLKELVTNGIDKDTLKAALNYFEFKYREADFGSYPPGLMYGLQMFDSWLYDDSKPFIHIEAGNTFKKLRELVETDYFEKLLKSGILDNNHKSIVVVEPKKNLVEQEERNLAKKLADYKATLSELQVKQIVEDTRLLREYQESEDSPENLACIPVLEKEDIKKETGKLYNEVRKVDDFTILYHPIFTNGIDYIRVLFPVKNISAEYLPYIGLLKSILGVIDTKNYSYAELFNQIHLKTGGMVPAVNVYTNSKDLDDINVTFEWKVKTLEGKIADSFSLVEEILFTSKLNDEKRLKEILGELKSRIQSQMLSAGHQVASGRCGAYYSKAAAIQELINGMPVYRLICDVEADFDNKKVDFINKLQEVSARLFVSNHVMFDFTGTEEEYLLFEKSAKAFWAKLAKAEEESQHFEVAMTKKNEGFTSASQVQYVCQGGNYLKSGLKYTGALRVLKVIMGYDYLWNNVRVKGGAYGCMCSFSKSGDCYFVSYRDPNLKKTKEVYEHASEYIRNFVQDDRSMTQYIIGAISEMDTPLTPAGKALRSLSAYMTNQTEADYQEERDELLETNQEVIRGLSVYVDSIISQEYFCVVGNEEKVKAESELFDTIKDLL